MKAEMNRVVECYMPFSVLSAGRGKKAFFVVYRSEIGRLLKIWYRIGRHGRAIYLRSLEVKE